MPAPWSVRVLGALLLALAGLLAGRIAQRPYARRVEELQRWQTWLTRLASEVVWQGRELGRAVQAACAGTPQGVSRASQRFVAGLGSERTTDELWCDSVRAAAFLSPEDIAVLSELGPVLGRYSREQAVAHLEVCRARLARLEAEARRARDGTGRALGSLVALSAVALAVLVA